MSTILRRDSLRQVVEAMSGGLQTILYTAKGQPCYMNIVEKYDLSTIDSALSGTHPAFIVGGVEKDVLYIGTYEGSVSNGELVSQPNKTPFIWNLMSTNRANARACGNGFHMMTNAEWSAVALKSWKENTQPLGNSYYGRSAENAALMGRRPDGKPAGTANDAGYVYTGSGPAQWRHNQKYNGISDLAGNVQTIVEGIRYVGNELQVIPNNNAALLSIDLTNASTEWKAINAITGEFMAPDGTGTTANSVRVGGTGFNADYSIKTANDASIFRELTQGSTTKPISEAALKVLKTLLVYPLSPTGDFGSDVFRLPSINSQNIVYPTRGFYFTGGTGAGIFASWNNLTETGTNIAAGRLAYYKP